MEKEDPEETTLCQISLHYRIKPSEIKQLSVKDFTRMKIYVEKMLSRIEGTIPNGK